MQPSTTPVVVIYYQRHPPYSRPCVRTSLVSISPAPIFQGQRTQINASRMLRRNYVAFKSTHAPQQKREHLKTKMDQDHDYRVNKNSNYYQNSMNKKRTKTRIAARKVQTQCQTGNFEVDSVFDRPRSSQSANQEVQCPGDVVRIDQGIRYHSYGMGDIMFTARVPDAILVPPPADYWQCAKVGTRLVHTPRTHKKTTHLINARLVS